MKRAGKWLGALIALTAACVVMYRISYPSVTIRYRLILQAEVDGQSKTGSGVREITYAKVPMIGSISVIGSGAEFRGEAVALDLGTKGTLFALLKEGSDPRSSPEWIVPRAAKFPHGILPDPIEKGLQQVSQLSGKYELPLTSLPLLVRFRDLKDPRSVERVDPLNIGKSFGDGAMLTRVTLEIVPAGIWPLSWFGVTGEPITTGIEGKLVWLPKYFDRQFDDRRFETIEASNRLANSLNSGAFKAGL